MGNGDDELGKILIKGFIYALSQMETHPDTILFYNGGAKLTTEDSESLEDLKKMEEEGVEILTCGTCLKHYGLMEKLMVGKVTDMYTIAERMTGADKVIVMDKGKVVMQGTPREIFSQVGKLKEYRLDVPQVTILADPVSYTHLRATRPY